MRLPPRWMLAGRVFMLSWLLFLVPVAQSVVTTRGVQGDPLRGLAELAGVAALYAWFWFKLVGTRNRLASTLAVAGVTALLALFLLPMPRQYESYLFFYAIFMAGAAYSWKQSVVAVVVVIAIGALVDLAHGLSPDYIVQVQASNLFEGLAVVGAGRLLSAYSDLKAAREEIARLAVSEERLRFARDVHDLLGQSLTMVIRKSELAARGLPADTDADTRDELRDIARIARTALQEVRQAVAGYRRPTLEGEMSNAQAALKGAGLGVAVENSLGKVSAAHDTVLAWALREGVTNVVRHSGATGCAIRLARHNASAILEITDNGKGGAKPVQPGNGLHGLEERVAVLGGVVSTESVPDGRFRLHVAIPLTTLSTSQVATPS